MPIAWTLIQEGGVAGALKVLDAHLPDNVNDRAVRVIARINYSRDLHYIAPSSLTEQHVREFMSFFSPLDAAALPLWLRRYVVGATWRLQHRALVAAYTDEHDNTHWDKPADPVRSQNCEELRYQRQRLLAMPPVQAAARLRELDALKEADFMRRDSLWDVMIPGVP
jgi:hypothetical protein